MFPANYAVKAATQQRVSGNVTPDIKTITGQTANVLATELNPTRMVIVAGQGNSNQTIVTRGSGSCQAPSTHNIPLAIPYLSSQMTDSYGLPIDWAPQEGDRIRLNDTTPGNPLAQYRVKPKVQKLPLTGLTVGHGLIETPYGKYAVIDANGVTHPAPGADDPVVQKPKLEVELAAFASVIASGLKFGGDDNNGIMADLLPLGALYLIGNQMAVLTDEDTIIHDPITGALKTTGSGTSGPTSNLMAKRGTHVDFTAAPTETPSLALHAGTELSIAPYLYALTHQTLAKETPLGPSATITTTAGNQEVSATVGAVNTTTYPDAVSRGLYRSHDGGTTWHLVTSLSLAAQTYVDLLTDTVVDANQQPPTALDTVIETWLLPGTSGLTNVAGTDGNRLAIALSNTGTALDIPGTVLAVKYDTTTLGINPSNELYVKGTVGATAVTQNSPHCYTLGDTTTLSIIDSMAWIGAFGSSGNFTANKEVWITEGAVIGSPAGGHGLLLVTDDPQRIGANGTEAWTHGEYGAQLMLGNGFKRFPWQGSVGLCEPIGSSGEFAMGAMGDITGSYDGEVHIGTGNAFSGTPNGTYIGINHNSTLLAAQTSQLFNFLDFQVRGIRQFSVGSTGNMFTGGGLTSAPAQTTVTPLTITAQSGQTAPLATATVGASTVYQIGSGGNVSLTPTATSGTLLSGYAPSTTSGDLLRLGTVSGGTPTPVLTVSPTGSVTTGTASAAGNLTVNGTASIVPVSTLSDAFLVNAPASFSAYLARLAVNTVNMATIDANGNAVFAGTVTAGGVVLGAGKSWSVLTDGAGNLVISGGDVVMISY